jgi:2-polyprenyl-3-methyl-5-hydroxy-6-metoxy-1,4-benzoquinol methylase
MYGSQETDLVVKYYDEAFGISADAEVSWYLEKVKTYGGPVLDIACGTGRMALLIAQLGYEIFCIDQSEGMLRQFEKKLQAQPVEIQQRVHIHQVSMREFRFNQKFKTIICCDAFFHNLTVADEIESLANIASHLAPEGRFVFNLVNPTCEFILNSAQSDSENFSERGRYPLADTAHILVVEQSNRCNRIEQTVTTRLRFTRCDMDGNVLETGESSWTSRYLFRYEAVHLLYRCGFAVEALVGDYHLGAVGEAGQLIFEARLGV